MFPTHGRGITMKRILLGSIAAAFMTAAVAAQGTPPPQTPPQTPPAAQQPATPASDTTLVGCVTQGSAPTVYIFENAVDPAKKDAKPRTFKIVAKGDIDLTQHLNHKVQLKGEADSKMPPPPPPGGKVDEKDLPVFTITSVTHVATTCSAVGQ